MSRFAGVLSRYQGLLKQRLPVGWTQAIPSKFDNVIVAMSSGVDSSLSAALFNDYPNTRGIYMRNWSNSNELNDENKKNCDEQDWKDAVTVADYLNIPIDLVNFEKDYWIDVFEPMLNSYQFGSTPNPDILCNKFVKFGKLKIYLDNKYGIGNYWLIMGHYARFLLQKQKFSLFRGIDSHKDQSYYLSQVNYEAFNQTIVPMGHLYKTEVREMASQLELPSAKKPDSQGICFVNNSQTGKFKNFLKDYIATTQGDIITIDEHGNKKAWGKHDGLWSYTIGQKIGISMPQANPLYKGTWFVSEKIPETNEIVIVKGGNHPKLFHNIVTVGKFEILNGNIAIETFNEEINSSIQNNRLWMQYRSLQKPIKVSKCIIIEAKQDMIRLQIELEEPQRAMAAGQYCCLYSADQVLGSGPIINTRHEEN